MWVTFNEPILRFISTTTCSPRLFTCLNTCVEEMSATVETVKTPGHDNNQTDHSATCKDTPSQAGHTHPYTEHAFTLFSQASEGDLSGGFGFSFIKTLQV